MLTLRIGKPGWRAHVPHSIKASEFIRQALKRKRCLQCRLTGLEKCLKCHGKGMIFGDGVFFAGGSDVYLEPCRSCIGTGKQECHCCSSSKTDALMDS